MIAYIQGEITFKCPAYIIIECGGIGHHINISLNTYSKIQNLEHCKLHTYFHVKEDSHTLYGFADEKEKEIFVHLISISGIGPNTGRMILSSLSSEEIIQAIIQENVALIESVKGIGPKSAKRIILELKDKLLKGKEQGTTISAIPYNSFKEEALSALVMLGFTRISAEKAVNKVLQSENTDMPVEQLIKEALKQI